jgi:hypothetical protein
MAGVVSKPLKSGKHRAWFMGAKGEQLWLTGTTNKDETLKLAIDSENTLRLRRLRAATKKNGSAEFTDSMIKEARKQSLRNWAAGFKLTQPPRDWRNEQFGVAM